MSAALLAALPWRPVLVGGADFDGSNDYMLRGANLTNVADGKVGTLSVWFRIDGGDGTSRVITASATDSSTKGLRVSLATGNALFIIGETAGDAITLNLNSSVNTYTASATWHHLLASWHVTNDTNHLYVDGVDVGTVTTSNDNNIDYTTGNWGVGAEIDGGAPWNGALTELWLDLSAYMDITVAANRAKFRTPLGTPAYLGADGSLPTGTAPAIYQRLAAGQSATSFATNRGTGGDFTITGTLDVASTSPSD